MEGDTQHQLNKCWRVVPTTTARQIIDLLAKTELHHHLEGMISGASWVCLDLLDRRKKVG